MNRLFLKTSAILCIAVSINSFQGKSAAVIKAVTPSVFNPLPEVNIGADPNNKRVFEDLSNVEAMLEKINATIIDSMYNINQANMKRSMNRINKLSYYKDRSMDVKLTTLPRKLGNFKVEGYEMAKEYSLKDGNIIYGVDEIIRVYYNENGQDKEETIRISLGYVPSIKSFRIIDMKINK